YLVPRRGHAILPWVSVNMWQRSAYLRLFLGAWKRWPLLEKVKVAGQYVGVIAAVIGVTLTFVKLTDSSAPGRSTAKAVRSSAIPPSFHEEAEERQYSDLSRFDELEANGATVRHLRSLLS